MNANMTEEKRADLIRQYTARAKEFQRTGDTVLRDETISDLRDIAPRAVADKIIAEIMGK